MTMTTWLTSDQHFSHDRIISYSSRPFSTVEEMDEALVDNFNKRVGSSDITYHIGDFSMREKVVPLFLPRLNGKHILIAGNHDAPHPSHRSHKGKEASIQDATRRYIEYGFAEIHLSMELDGFLLHHMPYTLIDRFDKFDAWRPKRNGNQVLLCGHVHKAFKYVDGQYNVGVDVNNYALVALEEVKAFLTEQNNG